jgi:AcrR family transcriptional regulator
MPGVPSVTLGAAGAAGSYDVSVTLSAKGTRLNRKGLETRTLLLETAVASLAEGGPEAVSANQIARRAGVTWGVVQHQFGDVDGLWAAVLDHISGKFAWQMPMASPDLALPERVRTVVDTLWPAVDLPGSHALYNLRMTLPRKLTDLQEQYPRTAAALGEWDVKWTAACERAFEGLGVDRRRLRQIIALLPGAMMGLRNEQFLVTYADLDDAREGLTGAITAYLSATAQESRER